MKLSNRSIVIGTLLAMALVGGATWAWAQGGRKIMACAAKDGTLRIIADPSECKARKETVWEWNIVGPTGPSGPQGETGSTGPTGPTGVLGFYTRYGTHTCEPLSIDWAVVLCDPGDLATGGGFNPHGWMRPRKSYITDEGNGWFVRVYNPESQPLDWVLSVRCADVTP